jgi:putative DNA-invertase from lambdoid prophage Rac
MKNRAPNKIERTLISRWTKEALARKKSEGVRLGRPTGSLAKQTKLTDKEAVTEELLAKPWLVSTIAVRMGQGWQQ